MSKVRTLTCVQLRCLVGCVCPSVCLCVVSCCCLSVTAGFPPSSPSTSVPMIYAPNFKQCFIEQLVGWFAKWNILFLQPRLRDAWWLASSRSFPSRWNDLRPNTPIVHILRKYLYGLGLPPPEVHDYILIFLPLSSPSPLLILYLRCGATWPNVPHFQGYRIVYWRFWII